MQLSRWYWQSCLHLSTINIVHSAFESFVACVIASTVTIVSIYFSSIFFEIHTKDVCLLQAYRKLEYICISSLPFSVLKKRTVYVTIVVLQ